MKCGIANVILTFALGALAVSGVMLVVQTIRQTGELQTMAPQITVENGYLAQAQMFLGEVAAYNQKYPSLEITKLLQSLPKPASAK